MQYVVENGREEVLIKHGDAWVPMDKYLRENYQSKHEMIRENVLSQTLTFDHRVQEFIKNIMMNKDSPFSVKYYSYRVEFQLRGAAHCHGTIWVDFEKYFEKEIEEESKGERKYKELIKTTAKNPKTQEDVRKKNEDIKKYNAELKNEINAKVNMMNKVFDKLRNEELDDGAAENSEENELMIKELQKFADRWTSVSLKNPRTKHLVELLNCHVCTRKGCHKYSEHCRFRFPRFPTLKTLIAMPAKIKYPDEEEREKAIAESKQIKEKVRNILENKDIMEIEINSIGKKEIEEYMEIEKNIAILEDIREMHAMKNEKLIDSKMKDYTKKLKEDVIALFHEDDKEIYEKYTWSDKIFQDSIQEEQDELKEAIKRQEKLNPLIELDELNMHDLSSSDSGSDYVPDLNIQDLNSSDSDSDYDSEIEIQNHEANDMDVIGERYYKVTNVNLLIEKYENLRAEYDLRPDYNMKNIEKKRLNKLLEKADIPGDGQEKNANYEKALSLSYGARGYEVVLKRDTDEIFINNYNPEYLMAWDSNMDIQVCLDYFAIITYILDYKMKDESGTLDKVTKALKEDASGGLRQKLKLVAHTFMTHRRAGESEIMYKLFPFLHLTQSNIAAMWMPTGFKENMSRMMQEISVEQAQHMEDVIQHEDKLYVPKENIYEKYLDRDDKVLCMTYTQFAQRYQPCQNPKLENFDLEQEFYDYNVEENDNADEEKTNTDTDDVVDAEEDIGMDNDENEGTDYQRQEMDSVEVLKGKPKLRRRTKPLDEILEDDFLFEYNLEGGQKKRLPRFIPLKSGKWMKMRAKRVLRFHKIKQTTNPHEYYYTEMQKYTPFKSDADLFPDDPIKCIELYNSKLEEIKEIKQMVLPHLQTVTEGRERAEEFLADVGIDLDPMNEQNEDIARQEGDHEDDEMAILDPAASGVVRDTIESTVDRTYRKIEIENEDVLQGKILGLDKEQRAVVDHIVGYARDFKMHEERPNENPKPVPPLLLVHGKAGTGKSHVIDVLSQLLEKTFRRSGDNPDNPYILRLAFTGSAADLIAGQTINKTLGLPHSNTIRPMPDKIRDLRRTQLQNLRLIIIDEISLVSVDQIYQIHFRLSNDIKQNGLPFGNIALVVLGDLLQIKPISGPFVFMDPANKTFQLYASFIDLWKQFKAIELKTNHRSGEYRIYADLLNRVRVGLPTKEDIDLLNSRVFKRNSPDLPEDAVFCSGENKIINEYNTQKLNKLHGELYTRKADVFSNTKKQIKSPITENSGIIRGTNVPIEVNLKIGARVMLTFNIDVVDSLVNGSMGEVVGFKQTGSGNVKYVMVKFDNEKAGKNSRREINFENEFPGATAIGLLEQEYEQGKKENSTPGTAINWPLKLSWGITIHKAQGMTVKYPMALVLDLDCWLRNAMIYVALSRVQAISQLYILEKKSTSKYKNNYNDGDKIPTNMMKPWIEAMEEMERLQEIDIGSFLMSKPTKSFKIASLNCVSLPKHFKDIKADRDLMTCNAILLQESTFTSDMRPDAGYDIGPSYKKKFNSQGKNKGLATYYPKEFHTTEESNKARFQMTTVESDNLQITNVYRSHDAGFDFERELKIIFNNMEGKNHLIMGDFNYCLRYDVHHPVKNLLEKYDYKAVNNILHQPPQATQIKGRCLDQAWIKIVNDNIQVQNFTVKTCVYSDHEKIEVELLLGPTSSTNPVDDPAPALAQDASNYEDHLTIAKERDNGMEGMDTWKEEIKKINSARKEAEINEPVKRKKNRHTYEKPQPKEPSTARKQPEKKCPVKEPEKRKQRCVPQQPQPSTQVMPQHRRFANSTGHACWMNSVLQTLMCGLDYQDEHVWDALHSQLGKLLKSFRMSHRYQNSPDAINLLAHVSQRPALTQGDQDPEEAFEIITASTWDDVKTIFGHTVTIRSKFHNCHHYSQRSDTGNISFRLPLPYENNENLVDYLQRTTHNTSKLQDHFCDSCYRNRAEALEAGHRGSDQTTTISDHRENNFILIKFRPQTLHHQPFQFNIDTDRYVVIKDKEARECNYELISVILYMRRPVKHYVAHVKSKVAQSWVLCDDSTITPIPTSKVGQHENCTTTHVLLRKVVA